MFSGEITPQVVCEIISREFDLPSSYVMSMESLNGVCENHFPSAEPLDYLCFKAREAEIAKIEGILALEELCTKDITPEEENSLSEKSWTELAKYLESKR